VALSNVERQRRWRVGWRKRLLAVADHGRLGTFDRGERLLHHDQTGASPFCPRRHQQHMSGVRLLAEPEGRTDERGPAETSPVPEGAAYEHRQTARSPAPGSSVQALRGKPHPASDLESLDMHAGMDEPWLLVRLLATIAEEHSRGREEWAVVARHARACDEELEKLNELPRQSRR